VAVKKKHQLGDGPVEKAFEGTMRFLASYIDRLFNGDLRGKDRKTGFVLMVFNFGDAGRANYMSNADRADVVAMMKEQIARFEEDAQKDPP
jgi:hypothetical protein